MPRYAHIQNGAIGWEKDYSEALDPLVMARKGIVEIFVTNPPFDRATQVRTGPVETVQADRVDRVFSVRDKTAAERNAEDDAAAIAGFDGRLLKAFALAVLDELTALGATTTPAQFRAAVIQKYRGTR